MGAKKAAPARAKRGLFGMETDVAHDVSFSIELSTDANICAGAQIGVNVTILPYVRIGAGALVGAGSVVTRDIPAGAVAFGNPAVNHRAVAELPIMDERVVADNGSASRYRLARTMKETAHD